MNADEDGYDPFQSAFICGPKNSSKQQVSVAAVAAVAVDLAADFAAWPSGAVDIHIRRTVADRVDQFINFAGVEALVPRREGSRDVRTYIGSQDCSGYRCRWRRTRLNSCRTIAEVRAEEH